MHSEICPVCLGTGMINEDKSVPIGIGILVQCHGCLGSGWVVVPDDFEYYFQDWTWSSCNQWWDQDG